MHDVSCQDRRYSVPKEGLPRPSRRSDETISVVEGEVKGRPNASPYLTASILNSATRLQKKGTANGRAPLSFRTVFLLFTLLRDLYVPACQGNRRESEVRYVDVARTCNLQPKLIPDASLTVVNPGSAEAVITHAVKSRFTHDDRRRADHRKRLQGIALELHISSGSVFDVKECALGLSALQVSNRWERFFGSKSATAFIGPCQEFQVSFIGSAEVRSTPCGGFRGLTPGI